MAVRHPVPEDLVSQPVATLRQVCLGIGEEFEPRMLEYPTPNRNEQMEPLEFVQWKERTLQAPGPEAVSHCMVKLSGADRDEYERIATGVLLKYGYSLD